MFTTLPSQRTEVRLLRLANYGSAPGHAPFPEINGDRRLEDIGLVERENATWIAIAVRLCVLESSPR